MNITKKELVKKAGSRNSSQRNKKLFGLLTPKALIRFKTKV